VTTPTSRRRDVRASTATAPAADEERGAQFSPALAKKRENGCRLLLLRYTSGRQPPSNYLGRALSSSRAYLRHEANSLPQPHAVTTLTILFPSLIHQRCLFLSYSFVTISPSQSRPSPISTYETSLPSRSPSPPLPYHRVSNHQPPP